MKDLVTYFGLEREPFGKDIKTSRLLETEPLRETGARLDYLKRRGGVMLLTGDPGVGKTVALRRFTDGLNENLFHAIYTPLSTLKRSDLLRHINEKLGLPPRPTKSAVYTQIQREILESREGRGRTIVLLLDEAHLLQKGPLEELRLLTNFRMDSLDPFLLVLCGQTDLKRTMEYAALESFAQRLSMRYHVPALSMQQTAEYVAHHLELAGACEPLFSESALQALHEASFGIPRRIGSAARDALTYAMFDEKRSVDPEAVVKVKSRGLT